MKHTFWIALCWPLLVSAQSPPLYWTDQPEGLVISSMSTLRYDGAATPGNQGEMILAWCDARDGNGRVIAQKVSGNYPDGPGAWSSELGELGMVEGLVMPYASGSAYMPWVVGDGEGGAIVCWLDVESEEQGTLRLCRVGDGAGGQGALIWPEVLELDDEVWVDYDDCRTVNRERCRSVMYDGTKALCADGSGGAWVLWRKTDRSLWIQHVDGAGTVDPDFPAEGLPLSDRALQFGLASNGPDGAAVLYREDDTPRRLKIQGVRDDGTRTFREGGRPLNSKNDNCMNLQLSAFGSGRVLAAWVDGSYQDPVVDLRIQLLDENLADLLEEDGRSIADASRYSRLWATASANGEALYLAWREDPVYRAQKLDAAGEILWGEGRSLDVVGDQQGIELLELLAVQDALYCLLGDFNQSQDNNIYVQRFNEKGAAVWADEQSELASIYSSWFPRALASDGAGGLLCAWAAYDASSRAIRVQHRQPDATDLIATEQSTLLSAATGNPGMLRFLAAETGLLAFWMSWDEPWMQAVDASSGTPLLDHGGRRIELENSIQDYDVCPDGTGGAWLAREMIPPDDWATVLELCRVGAEGELIGEPALVTPGVVIQDPFFGQELRSLKWSADRFLVGFEQHAERNEVRVQAFDPEGAPLWGDLGQCVHPQIADQARLLDLLPAEDGGADLVWSCGGFYDNHIAYHQRLDSQGQRLFEEHGGRGRILSEELHPWGDEAQLVRRSDGSLVVCWSEVWHQEDGANSPALRLACIGPDGNPRWRELLTIHYARSFSLELDAAETIHVSYLIDEDERRCLKRRRYLAWGALAQEWSNCDMPPYAAPWIVPSPCDTGPELLLGYNQWDGLCRLRAAGLNTTGGDRLAQRFHGSFLESPFWLFLLALDPDGAGGAYFGWNDYRCAVNDYGYQLRITRIAPPASVPALSAVPQATKPGLAQNHPNPFNPLTRIPVSIAETGVFELKVYNIAGQQLRQLHRGILEAGEHVFTFDASGLPTGIYFCVMESGTERAVRKMILLR